MLPVEDSSPREQRLSPRLMTRHAQFRMSQGPPSEPSIAEKDAGPQTLSVESIGRSCILPNFPGMLTLPEDCTLVLWLEDRLLLRRDSYIAQSP